ncbi:ATP-binding cassette domain-containing protein [Lactobacillus sp. PV037]|uniref:ATP-binding cassette domain-containing protein n=1 Tax=Lactobacillus sp. PV037 TaxID=2594496 RepID=UPI002240B50D|nr:ATPase, T2SS/T4P/T4SS family [Lactobacillus sp. PV037]QNQ84464.1 ATP-binding cassette domain-containing protein [Lactobacillus sp. PV037]
MEPELLLLDEAFSNCDPSSRKLLLKQLLEFKKRGMTIVAIDHQTQGYESLVTHQLTITNKSVHFTPFTPPVANPSKKTLSLPVPKNKIFTLNNYSLSLPQKTLLNNVTNYIPQGITLLTGENGSGKSAFFNSLIKMMPYQGHLLYQEKEVRKLRQKKYLTTVGEVFTDSTPQFLKLTAAAEIATARRKTKFFSQKEIDQMIKELNLPDLDQSIYTLSGGQKKKLQILLMLLENHRVLLLDEPLTGLDYDSQQLVCKWLKKSARSKNIVIISHQVGPLSEIINYHLHLKDQNLVFESSLNLES